MQHSSLCCSQPALWDMHALPALCTNWSFSSPAGLFHVAHRLCAACMWCLFGPPDWSVCHPVASSTCLQVQALLALHSCSVQLGHLHCVACLFYALLIPMSAWCSTPTLCHGCLLGVAHPPCVMDACLVWQPTLCHGCLLGVAHPPCVMDACLV